MQWHAYVQVKRIGKLRNIRGNAIRVCAKGELAGWCPTHPRTTIQVRLGRVAHRCKQLRGAVKTEVVEHERGRHYQDRSNYCESFQQLMALDGCWRVWENIKGRPDFQGLSRSRVQSLRSCLLMSGWEGTLVVGRYAAHFPIWKGHAFLSEAAQ